MHLSPHACVVTGTCTAAVSSTIVGHRFFGTVHNPMLTRPPLCLVTGSQGQYITVCGSGTRPITTPITSEDVLLVR
ncbi:hypothetical protein KIPB_009276 [Kipferlia bialata]|uniref:Uncharacterized protein n=1 Tax=Kipferlia bialata TaxID=797122 RepID=A0A9K3D223_9EUKA|nr:hypothetical protein KIPB_009276 [Kipferlia bialata]|eukprot:g9276.t1